MALIPMLVAAFPEERRTIVPTIGSAEASQSIGAIRLLPRNPDVDSSLVQSISSRPLFSASRRALPFALEEQHVLAAPVTAPIEEKPAPRLPSLALIGLIQSEGGNPEALLALEGDQERWIQVGDKIEDWNITAISENGVVFELDGELVTFEFESE